jgi:hypothetical protein
MTTKVKPRSKPKAKRRKKSQPGPPPPMVRTSERSSFKRCVQQWQWGYVEGLKPRDEAPALRFGSLVHKALEVRYPPGIKRGPKPAETFEKAYHAELKEAEKLWGFRDADEEWESALDLGVDMLEAYVEEYGRDEEWEVIASEMTFKVPIYTPFIERPGEGEGYLQLDGSLSARKRVLFYYVGTMDGVWKSRMDGGVRINDYKTTKGDPERESEGKTFDEQSTAYWTWGVDWLIKKKILKPKDQEALDGMLYTFLRKAKRDERPQNADGYYLNKDGSVSQKQPPSLFHRALIYRGETDRENARQRATEDAMEMARVRRGDRAVTKSPGTGYPDMQCKACQFRDMCELHEVGADWEALRDAMMTIWNPYDAHEVKEEGR